MTDPQPTGKLIVGYFPGWAIHAQNYHVSDIPADKLTHVNYAFAGVSDKGECVSIRPQDDQINFPALQLLKQQHHGLKTFISIGGAAHSNNFSKAVENAAARQHLAQSCLSFMKAGGFDGIDIDWEFPRPADKSNYTALLKELRSQLNVQSATDGVQYLLTAALPAGPEYYANLELGQIYQYIDWINLMAYNFYTATSSKTTHFSSGLYSASSDPEPDSKKHYAYDVDAAVRAYLSVGVPAAKLVVGVPFFGHGWAGVPNVNHGLYQPATGPAYGTWANDGIFDFQDLSNNYVESYLRFWSAEASAPWLYSPDTGIMISYDDAKSVTLKADYVNANRLGGMMIWPLSADDAQSSLANALSDHLNPPATAPAPPPETAPVLTGSSRRVPKATLVSLQLPPPPSDFGFAVAKFGFLSHLRLQPGEVEAARNKLNGGGNPPRLAAFGEAIAYSNPVSIGNISISSSVWDALRAFEGSPIPSQLPSPSVFAAVPAPALLAFGKTIADIRQLTLDQSKQLQSTAVMQVASLPALSTAGDASALNMYNAAVVAINWFEINVSATPIGMLNLERIEMTPVGIERGELIATIPLAPLEKTAVVHKEWSVTSKEFTSIVTDSLENYSETGVTENTELAQATTSQTSHSNQFNVNGTVSGGFGPVTSTFSSSFTAQDQNSDSANESRKHAIATTRKASTRVKQEHKVTISTTTVTGTSETSTRIIENMSPTDPIRIDYFSMMRKWHVGLYRYGLRLTYDIAIPEPGAAMRKIYADLEKLRDKVGPFHFGHKFTDITRDNWPALASQYDVTLPKPPEDPKECTFTTSFKTEKDEYGFFTLPLDLPDGYQVTSATLTANLKAGGDPRGNIAPGFTVMHVGDIPLPTGVDVNPDQTVDLSFLEGLSGQQYVTWGVTAWAGGVIEVDVQLKLTDDAFKAWQEQAWNALYNAAQTQYYAEQQDIQARISALEDKISNVDTLTLRREENEEIMKCVLRWLLGPNFHFMPDDVLDQFVGQAIPFFNPNANIDIFHGTVLDATRGDGLNVTASGWYPMFLYQEMVKFINEAIEWENVLYFLYSYFWDVPPSWDFIRQLRHPDVTRQAFLRAGSARVVLTVRQGWEKAWVAFVEGGKLGTISVPDDHPYMTIAQEIQAYNQTNYPGIPPANPGGGPLPDGGAYAASESRDNVPESPTKPVTIAVKDSSGFIVGHTAILDSWDTKVVKGGQTVPAQEKQTIIAVPDATHITVERLDNPHDGSRKPFPIMQGGEKGQLIAEWFEYTPTSGTDIAVTSHLATIA
jgi:GH18 family chitinase